MSKFDRRKFAIFVLCSYLRPCADGEYVGEGIKELIKVDVNQSLLGCAARSTSTRHRRGDFNWCCWLLNGWRWVADEQISALYLLDEFRTNSPTR